MTDHRTFLAAIAAVLVLVSMAVSQAADLPAPMPVKAAPAVAVPAAPWTGPYAGLFAGYGLGRASATSAFDSNTGFFYNWTGDPYSFDADGFFGGGTLGTNWQSGDIVFGIETEVGSLGLKGSEVDPNFQPATAPLKDTVTRFKSDFYAAAYGRIGIARGAVLLYGKGGVAFLKAEAETIDPCANAAGCGTTTLTMTGNKNMVGWSAGGGVEWMFSSQWSAKAEYLYFDFGSIDTAGPSSVPGESYRQSIDITSHTLRIGLNYRF